MSDILIIAPTKDYYRDPAQIPILDDIKDQTDAINLEEKTTAQSPDSSKKAPDNTELKRYHDMRAIHMTVAKNELETRNYYAEKEKTKRVNGVAFPPVDDSANNRYISIPYRHR